MSCRAKREIEVELRATGLPWSIQAGKKHLKIVLAGRLVGILPLKAKAGDSSGERRALLNNVAAIRRHGREIGNVGAAA